MPAGSGVEYNTAPAVTRTLDFPAEIRIVDSTIRSLQWGVSGSRHTLADLVEIGKALDALGVRELIVNPVWKDGVRICEALAQERLSCKLVAAIKTRAPGWEQTTDASLKAGVAEVCFDSIATPDQLKRAADLVRRAGKSVSHSLSTLYAYPAVIDVCREAARQGYASQSFHDSFFRFAITPEAVKFFIRSVKADVPECPPLYVHFSDFFGHATMTSVAALSAGATGVDVALNGVGHHCGHTSLAQVVLVLEVLYGVRTGIRLERLRDVSRMVADRTGVPMGETEPVVGESAFMLDGPIWAGEAGVPAEEKVYARFPFPPALVGSREVVVWSDRTMTDGSVRTKLSRMGLPPTDGVVREILKRAGGLLARKRRYPRWLSDREFEALCEACAAQAVPR